MRRLNWFIMLLMLASITFAQPYNVHVTAEPDLAEWDIIYLTDFDFENGMNNPLIFGYRMELADYPDSLMVNGNYAEADQPNLLITFQMIADVPSLSLDNELLFSATANLKLKAPILLTNRDLDVNLESRGIRDENGNKIEISSSEFNMIDQAQAEGLISTVLASGSMPAGYYFFGLSIENDRGGVDYVGFEPDKNINITTPANIDLTFPPDNHEFISDIYPVFEWNSSGCEDYFIRICEFDPLLHSSPEDALQSEASYPFPDNGGFAELGSDSQLDYSAVDGRPLEVGKSYVWQIKKVCATTSADEEIFSEIYTFTITEVGQSMTPCQQQLRSVLGDNQYNALFGSNGPLEGYGECPEVTLDGETLNATDFAALLVQLMSGAYEIESITTQ